MSRPVKTIAELSREARDVLYERLGVADTVRFLNQFELGQGDYTKERESLLGAPSVDEVAEEIRQYRRKRDVG